MHVTIKVSNGDSTTLPNAPAVAVEQISRTIARGPGILSIDMEDGSQALLNTVHVISAIVRP